MKTIELPDHLADALIATGKELATQDNAHSSWPIWYVTEIKKVQRTENNGEFKERIDSDAITSDMLCDSCAKKWKDDGEIPEDCDHYECADTFWWFDKQRQFTFHGSEFFLTQKACQEYIDANAYHFSDPKPYAGSAFRNYEIQPIIQALIIAAGFEVPSNHYGKVEHTDTNVAMNNVPLSTKEKALWYTLGCIATSVAYLILSAIL